MTVIARKQKRPDVSAAHLNDGVPRPLRPATAGPEGGSRTIGSQQCPQTASISSASDERRVITGRHVRVWLRWAPRPNSHVLRIRVTR